MDLNSQSDSYMMTSGEFSVKKSMSPRELILRYLPYLPWIIASITLALLLAFIKLRYSPNIYSVKGTILVKNQTGFNENSEKFGEMLFGEPSKDLYDEMQIIRSRGMAKRVVRSLNLEIQYFNEGKIRSTQVSSVQSPFNLVIQHLKDSSTSFSLLVTLLKDGQFIIAENGMPINFGQPFETVYGVFSLEKLYNNMAVFASNRFVIEYAPADKRANELVGGLNVHQSGESNNILELGYETENPRIGTEIINQWMKEYEQSGLEEKKKIAGNALKFIESQMDTVRDELGGVERNLLGYREKNRIISPEEQSTQVFSTVTELEKQLTTQSVQIQIIDNLLGYIADNRTPYRQVGSTLGILEPSLNFQIGEFNKLQVQRETLLKTTTRANPMVVDTEAAIEKLRQDILQNLKNIRQAYQLTLNNLQSRNSVAEREIAKIPSKQKQLLDITRRQKILEELYSFLLQKKLETSISSASTISNVRVIEPAMASNVPVKPNRKGMYLLAFFIGLLLPSLIIFVIEYLNDRVNSREDIQESVTAPIIGEVGHSNEKQTFVVTRTSRKFISEQFRIIRTNLQYVLPKKEKMVILVTSTTSGEGKSFISTNIGAVMSLAGKKTAILEFDIRKPKIMSSLGLTRKSGITNYIIGKANFEDLPVKVPDYDNLYVIPCGPIPPNPAELLLYDRFDEMLTRLKEEFDVLVIDTAPVGLVSDAIMLGKYADAVLYIIRHNYTFRKQLQLLNEIYANNRLPKISLVINDINGEGGYGRYYGYGGYGYTGYGYGYGNEYFEEVETGKSFFERFIGLFKRFGKRR
jgi:capsular exopolysaccharide synthesis family protein